MALLISVKIEGDQIVARRLRAIGNGINDLSLAMRDIGKEAIGYYASHFAYKGSPYGESWPDYSIQYKKWKEKHSKSGSAYPMLVFSGKMQEGFFATTTNSSVTIDNHMPYYKYHQSTAERTKIPRRAMAGINTDIKDMVKATIRKEIIRKIETA